MDSSPKPSDEQLQAAGRNDAFPRACLRVAQAIDTIVSLGESPTLKQQGMAVSSLLLRCREMNLRWKETQVCVPLSLPPDDALPDVARCVPVWPVSGGEWLSRKCGELMALLPEELSRDDHEAASPSQDVIARFGSRDPHPLFGEDGLLTGLPRLQEEITRRIYREDFLGE